MQVTYTTAKTGADMAEISFLQKANLPVNITASEKQEQGFVTVQHSVADLEKLNQIEPHVIAKYNDKVVGYILAMTAASANDIPVFVPMFEIFNKIEFQNKKISTYNYLVVGQVCIDRSFRGQGIFDKAYSFYKQAYSPVYDFVITEIDCTNRRSLKAHGRIGFKEIHRYISPQGICWSIVLWNWR